MALSSSVVPCPRTARSWDGNPDVKFPKSRGPAAGGLLTGLVSPEFGRHQVRVLADLNNEVATLYGMIMPGESKTETSRAGFVAESGGLIRATDEGRAKI